MLPYSVSVFFVLFVVVFLSYRICLTNVIMFANGCDIFEVIPWFIKTLKLNEAKYYPKHHGCQKKEINTISVTFH